MRNQIQVFNTVSQTKFDLDYSRWHKLRYPKQYSNVLKGLTLNLNSFIAHFNSVKNLCFEADNVCRRTPGDKQTSNNQALRFASRIAKNPSPRLEVISLNFRTSSTIFRATIIASKLTTSSTSEKIAGL